MNGQGWLFILGFTLGWVVSEFVSRYIREWLADIALQKKQGKVKQGKVKQ